MNKSSGDDTSGSVAAQHRRTAGALESEVLTILWAADRPLTPAEVRERVTASLAYTTIMTILARLHAKGLVERARVGRAFAYSPHEQAVTHTAARMSEMLARAGDTRAVLSRFVNQLDSHQEQVLRDLLKQAERED